MRQAIIENGIVCNICVGSANGIAIPDDSPIAIGWTYDGVFSAPLPTAEQLENIAEQIQSDLAKADVVYQYIQNHTLAEINTYIKTDVNAIGVTNLATAITALVKIENLLVKLAILHKIKD